MGGPHDADQVPLRLWSATVFGASFAERLLAAQAAGCDSLSLFPLDVARARAEGITGSRARERAEELGVRLAVVDPLATWLPGRSPSPSMSPADLAFYDFPVEEVLAMAVEMGAETISAIEPFGRPVPLELGAERFALACDRAAEHGLRLTLEFMPFSGIPTPAAAWAIVRAAGRPNGGLVLDTWHFFRSGADFDLLRTIPGDRIFEVQVSDGPPEPEADLRHAARHGRLLPGEGGWDLAAVFRTLAEIGARPSIGPEVFSDALVELGPAEAARRAAASTRALLLRG